MKWLYIILFAGLIFFRFSFLDQDAPIYQLGNVCQEDEPYYSEGAVLKLCKYEGRLVKGFDRTRNEALDMYNKPLTYASLKLLGNNYWGLRLPVVLISVLSLVLMFLTAKEVCPKGVHLPLILILLTNFYLFTFSRYNNPQIFSVCCISFAIWIVVKYGWQKQLPLFFSGLVSAFAVMFVYPMNFFLLAGIGTFVLIKAIQEKEIKRFLFFVAGVIMCFGALNICLYLIGQNLSDIISTIVGGGSGVIVSNHSLGSLLVSLYTSFASMSNTGYFKVQLAMLFVVIAGIPFFIHKALKSKDEFSNVYLLLLLILGMQFLQNCFAFNYSFKKMLVDLPITSLLFFLFVSSSDYKETVNSTWGKTIRLFFIVFGFVICYFNYKVNKAADYWSYSGKGCFGTTPGWFDVLNIVSCLGMGFAVLFKLFSSGRISKQVLRISMMLSVVANLMLTLQVYVVNRKYEIRDGLMGLKPLLNNKIVIGDVPYTYQLYTGCKPGLHGYDVNFISKPKHFVMDSMITYKRTDFVVQKVMQGVKTDTNQNKALSLVKVVNFDCYSYYVYKNNLIN